MFRGYPFFIGLDLGQTKDYTAMVVLEPIDPHKQGELPQCHIRHIERLPLGMPYTAQVAHVQAILNRPELRGRHWLGIDNSGVGRGVSDMFAAQGVRHEAVTITAPIKLEIVTALQVLAGAEKLKFNPAMKFADILAHELLNFEVDYTQAGNAIFNARQGEHDDLVLALGLACREIVRLATLSPPSMPVIIAPRESPFNPLTSPIRKPVGRLGGNALPKRIYEKGSGYTQRDFWNGEGHEW